MNSLKKVEGINVVPLIDIMLVLLTIVLTISSFISLGKIELTLPNGSSSAKIKPNSYEIAINNQNKFFINGIEIKRDLIEKKLTEVTKNDIVFIQADKLTHYEDFVFIVNILKNRGIEKINMAVKNE